MTRLLVGMLLCAVVVVPTPWAQTSTDERLATLVRAGRYADARRVIDQALKEANRDDLKNVRAVFARAPNMHVRNRPSTFPCTVTATGVLLPATVNGRRVDWLMDTGLNVTSISDAEAKRLGMTILGSDGRVNDLAGGTTGTRTAVAKRIVIGRTEFDDVHVLVLPGDQMPWKELPPGQQGAFGIPIPIALTALRWTQDGRCYTGANATAVVASAAPQSSSPLRFAGLHAYSDVRVEGRTLDFIIDTGNQAGTQLWERFGTDLPGLVSGKGRPGSVRVTQIGGSAERPVTIIPDLDLIVGGRSVRLASAPVFSRPVGDTRFHGLLGMDVLSQSSDVTIDFGSMSLRLR